MKFSYALTFIFAVNMLFFIAQVSVDNINPNGNTFFTLEGSLLNRFNAGNYTVNPNTADSMPTSESGITPETGNLFTDTWNSITTWFLEETTGGYVLSIVNALPNFLKIAGLPEEIVFGIGVLWHGLTLFLIVMILGGRTS